MSKVAKLKGVARPFNFSGRALTLPELHRALVRLERGGFRVNLPPMEELKKLPVDEDGCVDLSDFDTFGYSPLRYRFATDFVVKVAETLFKSGKEVSFGRFVLVSFSNTKLPKLYSCTPITPSRCTRRNRTRRRPRQDRRRAASPADLFLA